MRMFRLIILLILVLGFKPIHAQMLEEQNKLSFIISPAYTTIYTNPGIKLGHTKYDKLIDRYGKYGFQVGLQYDRRISKSGYLVGSLGIQQLSFFESVEIENEEMLYTNPPISEKSFYFYSVFFGLGYSQLIYIKTNSFLELTTLIEIDYSVNYPHSRPDLSLKHRILYNKKISNKYYLLFGLETKYAITNKNRILFKYRPFLAGLTLGVKKNLN